MKLGVEHEQKAGTREYSVWYENTCLACGVVNKVPEGESVEIGQVDTGGLGMASIGVGLLPGEFSVGKTGSSPFWRRTPAVVKPRLGEEALLSSLKLGNDNCL